MVASPADRQRLDVLLESFVVGDLTEATLDELKALLDSLRVDPAAGQGDRLNAAIMLRILGFPDNRFHQLIRRP